jgi:hypothetical protein
MDNDEEARARVLKYMMSDQAKLDDKADMEARKGGDPLTMHFMEEGREVPAIRYRIDPRPAELGGGWHLHLYDGLEEMGGGVFPPVEGMEEDPEEANLSAYNDAVAEGEDWISSRG